jgi:ligand-binding sensor domain-containing protein
MQKWLLFFVLALICVSINPQENLMADSSPSPARNRVLSLDGDGDYVEIANNENLNITSQLTMEAWIKPTAFPKYFVPIIYKGDKPLSTASRSFTNRSYTLWINSDGSGHLASAPSSQSEISYFSTVKIIPINKWSHIAGVIDCKNGVMSIFVNGVEVAKGSSGKDIHISKLPLMIGGHPEDVSMEGFFSGEMDEVRIWKAVRTQDEIKKNMFSRLSGNESGLVGYWNFDDPNEINDLSKSHADGKFIGNAHTAEAELVKADIFLDFAVISGTVKDRSGQVVPNAVIRLEQNGNEINKVYSDGSGSYSFIVKQPNDNPYDLFVFFGTKYGDQKTGIRLSKGGSIIINHVVKESVSIEGSILMMDDSTPHTYVPVQAVSNGKVYATALSDESGVFRFVNMKSGKYQIRCHVKGGYIYYMDGKILSVESGKIIRSIDFRFPSFKKGVFRNYDTSDGLADLKVHAIYQSPDGALWFSSGSSSYEQGFGVSRFDGREFTILTTKDGLATNTVWAICGEPDGTMWFGTLYGGVSRYDGKKFTNLTTKDGLISDMVYSIYRDNKGMMWFGTYEGVSRYDGQKFTNFTMKDGLPSNSVYAIESDQNGRLWFGTDSGLSMFDGKKFTTINEDDLAGAYINAIYCDKKGVMWFGTYGMGVFRYDGKKLTKLTTRDGLIGDRITSITSTPDGVMWFATFSGVSSFDGISFINFSQDTLKDSCVDKVYVSHDGLLWFGTALSGVTKYDYKNFGTLNKADGLPDNQTRSSYRRKDGSLWIGSTGAIVKYDGCELWRSPTVYDQKDGIGHSAISVVYEDEKEGLWFGTGGNTLSGGGVYLYQKDSRRQPFKKFNMKDGLAGDNVFAISSDGNKIYIASAGFNGGLTVYDGKRFIGLPGIEKLDIGSWGGVFSTSHYNNTLWFGTFGKGAYKYDGSKFTNFTEKDGLKFNKVWAVSVDKNGIVWFGTENGVSTYNGKKISNFDSKEGLGDKWVMNIYCAPDGTVWLATWGGGVYGYDGQAWTSLTKDDGLCDNRVYSINPDPDGSLWFSTCDGLTHYVRNIAKPKANVISIKADKVYDNFAEIPSFKPKTRITFEYDSIDFVTLPAKRQFRCRIKEISEKWENLTKSTLFDYTFDKPGKYTFEVQAIDRDLNYSEPASIVIKINPPPFYTRGSFIGGSIFLAFMIPSVIYAGMLNRKKKHTFEAISNPYIVGNPIRSESMFFGREDDFKYIHDKLVGSPTGLIIVLAGERRSGKTSILYQILNGRLGERFVPVFVDMQAMTVRSDAEFFNQIAQETMNAIKQKYPSINISADDYNFHDISHPAQTFQRYTDDLTEMLGDKTLLFLIDEYEILDSKVEDKMISGDSITFFASLLERNPRITILFTGSRHLEERSAPFWKVLLPKSIARYITFLSEKDTYRLISEPVHGKMKYAKGVHESIYRLSAGQPFYTQIICQNLVDRLNMEQRNTAELNDVSVIVRELEENPPPQMHYFWDSFTQNQQLVLSMLAELQEHEDQVISVTDMLRTVQEYNLPITLSEADWRGALEGLCRRDMIRRVSDKGEYQFRIDLFRPWIKHQHSIWSISDEYKLSPKA